jgi:voltage-gated potassium channel
LSAQTTALTGELESPRKRLLRVLEWAVVLAAVATIPLTIAEEQAQPASWLWIGDWVVWAVFTVEYAFGLATSSDRRRYVRSNKLGLAVILVSFPVFPAAFDWIRMVRLARLLRLLVIALRLPYSLRLALGRPGLLQVVVTTMFLLLAGGGLMESIEPETVGGNYWAAVWWALATVTTVGYGDIAPRTVLGRIIAALLMFSGIGLVSTLAASFAAYFVQRDERREVDVLSERLDRIEGLLQETRDRFPPPPGGGG